MVRIRKIKKIGNSWFIKLNPSDVLDYNLSEGDLIEIEDALMFGKKNKKRRTKNE